MKNVIIALALVLSASAATAEQTQIDPKHDVCGKLALAEAAIQTGAEIDEATIIPPIVAEGTETRDVVTYNIRVRSQVKAVRVYRRIKNSDAGAVSVTCSLIPFKNKR